MKAYDAYYTCEDPSCDAEPTVGSTETSQDWFTYVEDDDPYKPFCVPFEPNSTDNGYLMSVDYACKTIKCAHRRLLVTGDNETDF